MACLLIGHSFVRRIRGRYAPFGFRRYQEDISLADTHAAQDFAQGIKLSDVFHAGVHTFSSRSFITDIPVAWRLSCELLVLDIGSNDIAQSKTVNKRAMELLAKFIYDWASLAPARCVIFIGVLPRTAGLRGSARQFEQNRLYYNAALTSLCKDSNHMTFAKVRGFEGRDPIASVSSWSDDGIHPCSMEKYTRRLRFIVMRVYRYYTNN